MPVDLGKIGVRRVVYVIEPVVVIIGSRAIVNIAAVVLMVGYHIRILQRTGTGVIVLSPHDRQEWRRICGCIVEAPAARGSIQSADPGVPDEIRILALFADYHRHRCIRETRSRLQLIIEAISPTHRYRATSVILFLPSSTFRVHSLQRDSVRLPDSKTPSAISNTR